MKRNVIILSVLAILALGAGAGWRATAQDAPDVQALAREAAQLARDVQRMEDQDEIENLQRIYGFYVDKSMWSHVVDLYTDDGTLEIGGRGVFAGKDSIMRYLLHRGSEGPVDGRLYEHTQMQPVIHVSDDGRTAKGRWRAFIQVATWQEDQRWGMAIYENEYRKEDGVWKISKLHGYFKMYTPYEDGWGKTALPNSAPEPDLPPDQPPSVVYETYPTVFVPPFHYDNPVTSPRPAPAAEAPGDVEVDALLASLDDMEERITRLEDREAIERLHSIYGYYLARNQWDDLADIFASDGTIEIALRGRYVGHDSIRRNLDLYGEQGIHHGLLHHHMQYQPVIHIAEDGQTARMRSRAFSMMGQYGQYAQWMGGVYENTLVKQDGVWKIQIDQVFNTYFVPYDAGWANVVPRPAPGITESNPPDLPPSLHFEMFPKAFVPPFHYDNPVTGRASVWPMEE